MHPHRHCSGATSVGLPARSNAKLMYRKSKTYVQSSGDMASFEIYPVFPVKARRTHGSLDLSCWPAGASNSLPKAYSAPTTVGSGSSILFGVLIDIQEPEEERANHTAKHCTGDDGSLASGTLDPATPGSASPALADEPPKGGI